MNKAQRGELFHHVPWGYVKLSPERVEMDPDEQVREIIRLIFDKYDEIGTVWGVFRYLVRNNIDLGIRPFHGPNRGNLEWRRPTISSVRQVVDHPMYAGAYSYGRRPQQRVRTATGELTRQGSWVPMEQWKVLKRDCLPAYITWERYLGKSRVLAAAYLTSRHQGEPPQRLRTAHRPRRLRQLRPSPQDGSSSEREGLLPVCPTPLRRDRASVFRPEGRRG